MELNASKWKLFYKWEPLDWFLNDAPINNDIYGALLDMSGLYDDEIDGEMVFNNAYIYCIALLSDPHPENYCSKRYSELFEPEDCNVYAVQILVYAYLTFYLRENPECYKVNWFLKKYNKALNFERSKGYAYFNKIINTDYPFEVTPIFKPLPSPPNPKTFDYNDWRDLTNGYEINQTREVIQCWNTSEEQQMAIDEMRPCYNGYKKYDNDLPF